MRGIILRDEGETLVVHATQTDVRRFASGSAVVVEDLSRHVGYVPHLGYVPAEAPHYETYRVRDVVDRLVLLRRDDWLFDASGHPVCQVERLSVPAEQLMSGLAVIDPYTVNHRIQAGLQTRAFSNPIRDSVVVRRPVVHWPNERWPR